MSLHDFSRPPVVDHPTDDEPQLSLFQQTLREKDEEFYKTFPAARIAIEQDPYSYVWRPIHQMSSYLPGPSFQLRHVAFQGPLDYSYDVTVPPSQPLSQMPSSQSPSSLGFDSTHLPSSQNHYTGYASAQLDPTDGQGEQLVNAPIPPALNMRPPTFNLPYPVQPHHFHQPHLDQRVPSPVMDSLPSPDSASDPTQGFHHSSHYPTPPHQAYYTAHPRNGHATPSPTNHQDIPPPLSPPALVQATYPGKHEPEQQTIFTDPLPSPQRDSSIPPSRRNSQHALNRSQRRYSPPYSRPSHSTHKSGGSGNALPALVSAMGWPLPSSAPATPSGVGVSANAGTSLVDVVNTAGAAAARAPTTATVVPSPMPGPSISAPATLKPRPSMSSLNQSSAHRAGSANATAVINSKRNSDKKPALACVFCRGRKIACGPPLKDGDGKTCNQCHRRSLRCEYPTESRRGMRKKSSASTTTPNPTTTSLNAGSASLSDSNDASDNPKVNANSESAKATSNKKR